MSQHHPEESGDPAPAPLPEITIRLQPNGGVSVTGPLEHKVLCLGMLAMAENVVNTFRQGQQNGLTMPAPGVAIPNLRG